MNGCHTHYAAPVEPTAEERREILSRKDSPFYSGELDLPGTG